MRRITVSGWSQRVQYRFCPGLRDVNDHPNQFISFTTLVQGRKTVVGDVGAGMALLVQKWASHSGPSLWYAGAEGCQNQVPASIYHDRSSVL
jgi:hypothetical protein